MKRLTILTMALALCTAGCNSSASPSGPSVLAVDAFQTSIQPEPGGVRVQVRMRVVAGLADLERSVTSGGVRARTCRTGARSEASLSPATISVTRVLASTAIDALRIQYRTAAGVGLPTGFAVDAAETSSEP